MSYMNAGARTVAGQDFSTKKSMRDAIASNPANVTIYVTDALGPNMGRMFKADDLLTGVKYTVTGPNPYTSRKWYATVEKTEKGITVK